MPIVGLAYGDAVRGRTEERSEHYIRIVRYEHRRF